MFLAKHRFCDSFPHLHDSQFSVRLVLSIISGQSMYSSSHATFTSQPVVPWWWVAWIIWHFRLS